MHPHERFGQGRIQKNMMTAYPVHRSGEHLNAFIENKGFLYPLIPLLIYYINRKLKEKPLKLQKSIYTTELAGENAYESQARGFPED